MPAKPKMDLSGKSDLERHMQAVENSLRNLRFRVAHYYAERESIREEFGAVEIQFRAFSRSLRVMLDEQLKKH